MVIAETGGGKASHYVFFLICKGHWLSLQRENAQVSKILVYLHFHCHPRPQFLYTNAFCSPPVGSKIWPGFLKDIIKRIEDISIVSGSFSKHCSLKFLFQLSMWIYGYMCVRSWCRKCFIHSFSFSPSSSFILSLSFFFFLSPESLEEPAKNGYLIPHFLTLLMVLAVITVQVSTWPPHWWAQSAFGGLQSGASQAPPT